MNGPRDSLDDASPTCVTPRQREIIGLLAGGLSNDEIALMLGISCRTVRAHTDALKVRLGVTKRRLLPAAFRAVTGEDPLIPHSPARFVAAGYWESAEHSSRSARRELAL